MPNTRLPDDMVGQAGRRQKNYLVILSILLAMFCFRVAAQLLQRYFDLSWLPPFDAWQSGAVPYGALLISQILIILFYAWILWRMALNRSQPSRRQGQVFMVIGVVYFSIMAVRLFVGLTGLSGHHWFHSYLPTLFHFVLAGYLITVGRYHLQMSERRA